MPAPPYCTLLPLPYRRDTSFFFAPIQHAHGAIWLDSAAPGGDLARYDLQSAFPAAQFSPSADELPAAFLCRLRAALAELGTASLPDGAELPFVGGLIGWLSYDFGRALQQLPALSQERERDSPRPRAGEETGQRTAQLGLYLWALISDHQKQQAFLLFHPKCPPSEQKRLTALFMQVEQATAALPSPTGGRGAGGEGALPFRLLAPFAPDMPRAHYQSAFAALQHYIRAGDCYQVNLTQRWQAPCAGDPWSAYLALRRACPTPFAGFVRLGKDSAILSLSPERFLRAAQGQVETRPIKGTRPRGKTPQEDAQLAAELLASGKDRAENLMIVDLLRNDLSRSCQKVEVPALFALESYPNVHHLVSQIRARLAPGKDALDLLEGSFPGGSISGAPKHRAMQIIDEVENTPRGIYCGSLLYLDVRGEMDSSIAIRSLLQKDGRIYCYGGGGITAGSDERAEYEESMEKVRVLMQTLQQL